MRARALLVAWMLAAQTIAPSLALASTVRAGCCCATGSAHHCHCPACSKVRAIEEGHGLIGGCDHQGGKSLPGSLLVAAAARSHHRVAPAVAQPALPSAVAAPTSPIEEVPTPPPLA